MPLRHKSILSNLEADVQVTVSSVYLELCRLADARMAAEDLDRIRDAMGDRLLELALAGEHDRHVLAGKTAAEFGLSE
jgi:hypothetical protein